MTQVEKESYLWWRKAACELIIIWGLKRQNNLASGEIPIHKQAQRIEQGYARCLKDG